MSWRSRPARQLLGDLPYTNRSAMLREVRTVFVKEPGLRPVVYTTALGREFYLEGVVGIEYRGRTYNIPVLIGFPQDFPARPPVVFLRPDATMEIRSRPGLVSATDGRVDLVALRQWVPRSSLVQVVMEMKEEFARQPPLVQNPGTGGASPPRSISGRPASQAAVVAATAGAAAAAAPEGESAETFRQRVNSRAFAKSEKLRQRLAQQLTFQEDVRLKLLAAERRVEVLQRRLAELPRDERRLVASCAEARQRLATEAELQSSREAAAVARLGGRSEPSATELRRLVQCEIARQVVVPAEGLDRQAMEAYAMEQAQRDVGLKILTARKVRLEQVRAAADAEFAARLRRQSACDKLLERLAGN